MVRLGGRIDERVSVVVNCLGKRCTYFSIWLVKQVGAGIEMTPHRSLVQMADMMTFCGYSGLPVVAQLATVLETNLTSKPRLSYS